MLTVRVYRSKSSSSGVVRHFCRTYSFITDKGCFRFIRRSSWNPSLDHCTIFDSLTSKKFLVCFGADFVPDFLWFKDRLISARSDLFGFDPRVFRKEFCK